MFGITDLSTYLIGTIAIILLPGPNSLYCLSIAGRYGVKTAYRSIMGILLGDSLLMLATALGAATLFKLYPTLFNTIRLCGGLYLAYLGYQLLQAAWQKWQSAEKTQHSNQAANDIPPAKGIFSRALMLSLTNPKAILFFLSFFVQFVEPNYPHPALSFLILALILQIISFTYLNILVISGHHLTRKFSQSDKISASGMAVVGLLFIGFALKMWLGK